MPHPDRSIIPHIAVTLTTLGGLGCGAIENLKISDALRKDAEQRAPVTTPALKRPNKDQVVVVPYGCEVDEEEIICPNGDPLNIPDSRITETPQAPSDDIFSFSFQSKPKPTPDIIFATREQQSAPIAAKDLSSTQPNFSSSEHA